MTRSARIVLAGVVIGAGWTGQAPITAEAAGPIIQCESTITVDTTLYRDLVGCANNGIVIGADGVTLNLNGHTISGVERERPGRHSLAMADVVTYQEGAELTELVSPQPWLTLGLQECAGHRVLSSNAADRPGTP